MTLHINRHTMSKLSLRNSPVHTALDQYTIEWQLRDPTVLARCGPPIQTNFEFYDHPNDRIVGETGAGAAPHSPIDDLDI